MKKITLLAIASMFSLGVLVNCGGNHLIDGEDRDCDGLLNDVDPDPTNNHYQVELDLGDDVKSKPIDIDIDYRDFLADGYNKNLALLSSLFINDADGSQPSFINNVYQPSLEEKLPIFGQIGCQDIVRLKIEDGLDEDPYDVAGIYLGHHTFIYENNKYQIFFGAIDGYPSRKGWISNFDIGAWDESNDKITEGYKNFWNTDKHSKWRNHDVHKGFDVTANRLIDIINQYIGEHNVEDAQRILIFSGHSRAGALANLVAKDYVDNGVNAKAYSFNPPAVAKVSQEEAEDPKYHNIFTFTNTNDIVSRVPCPKYWKFTRYGKPIIIDVEKEGKDIFNNLYNSSYMGCTTELLDIAERMLADQSCLTKPSSLSDYDSKNLYEKWHYSNPSYDYEYFETKAAADKFVNFIRQHEYLKNSVEVTEPTYYELLGYLCTWKCKGASIINFLTDVINGCSEEVIEYYIILLYRVIMETIIEALPELSLDIPTQILTAHEQKIACVLAMCANK